MALIIEDGTGVANANSVVTVVEIDAAAITFNNTAWTALSAAEKEAAAVNAMLIVNDGQTYKYDGDRMTATQSLEWPRTGATYWTTGPNIPDSTIPMELKRGQINAALGIADGSIVPGGSAGTAGLVKTEKVDVISVTYFSPSETATAGASSGGLYSGIGWSSVTGIVAPLLDEAYYEAQAETGSGTSSATAARRGPSSTAPSYGGIWDVGQNDRYPGVDNKADGI